MVYFLLNISYKKNSKEFQSLTGIGGHSYNQRAILDQF